MARRLHAPTRRVALVAVVAVVLSLAVPPAAAQILRQLTDTRTTTAFDAIAVDDAGDRVVAISSGDPFGTNTGHAFQIFDWDPSTGSGAQVTAFDGGVGRSISISDDGEWIAFVSSADPLGTNNDRSLEAFRVRRSGGDLSQLTVHDPGAGSALEVLLCGDGDHVLLLDDGDPLGSNPGRRPQLFHLALAGGALVQLTAATDGEFSGFDASDDGTRVIFTHSGDLTGANADRSNEVFTVFGDGTGLTQRTVDTGSPWRVSHAISGDGGFVVLPGAGLEVRPWPGTDPLLRAVDGETPRMTDDGAWLYYESGGELRRVDVRHGPDELVLADPVGRFELAGSGARVVVGTQGPPPLFARSLLTTAGDGTGPVVLGPADDLTAREWEPAIAGDGSSIVFRSRRPDGSHEVGRIDLDDGGRAVVAWPAWQPWTNADGSSILFGAELDPNGDNGCGVDAVFRAAADGSSIRQISPANPAGCGGATYYGQGTGSADDSRAVLLRFGGPAAYLALPGDGGPATWLTDVNSFPQVPRLSDDGAWAVLESNDEGLASLTLIRTDGTEAQLVVNGYGATQYADISGDGQLVVWVSPDDPVGANGDGSWEVFVHDVAASTTAQLTQTTWEGVGGFRAQARVSRDGAFVYHVGGESPYEVASHEPLELFRIELATGASERVSGPRVGGFAASFARDNPAVSVDRDGDRVAFAGPLDPLGTNPDRSWELFLADYSTPARIRVGAAAPTHVDWDVEPSVLRYDVIRGRVAALAANGATVELGPVVCVEDDSGDADTAGFDDVAQPASGEVFFYVYRGSQGVDAPPASYGLGSGDRERIAGTGDCTP